MSPNCLRCPQDAVACKSSVRNKQAGFNYVHSIRDLFKIFALRMASSVKQHCAGPTVSIWHKFRARYGALSAQLFAIFKVIFTNNETFLLNKNRWVKVLSNIIHALVRIYFFLKGHLHGTPTLASFFQCSDPQPCMGVERWWNQYTAED